MSTTYDVAIVGAGPGGSATAYYLAKQGLSVLLLDKFTFPRDKTCGDALTPRALRILDDMGLLETILQMGDRVNTVEFIAPNGQVVIAPIPKRESRADTIAFVPRLQLDERILQHACTAGAEFQSPVRGTTIAREGQEMVVSGAYQRETVSFRARFVVLATGANVKLLLQAGILKKTPPMMLTARAYFEQVTNVPAHAQCYFAGVPLPGYGWVFPLSSSLVNVGVGFFKSALSSLWMPNTAHVAFDKFLQLPSMQTLLQGAYRSGPIKGYPIRVDFAHAPTFADGMFLVGESAGLVNPVTGEGIDYALESGKMAAEHLAAILKTGAEPEVQQRMYDQRLRQRYQHLFLLCDALRYIYLNPLVLNRAIKVVSRNEDLRNLYMNIAIENQDALRGISPNTLLKIAFS